VVLIPVIAVLGALAWPWEGPRPGPTPASTPPPATPPGGGGGPGAGNPPGGSHPGSGITNPGDAVGNGPGPAAPPSVSATGIDVVSDQVDPQPGTVATLTITVSGHQGSDRYGVSGAAVELLMTEQPGTDARLSATSVVTDAGGAAYIKLTLSKTRGRHVVYITSATLSAQYVADTLGAGGQVSRARHGGDIAGVPLTQHGSPVPFFVAAVISLALGFATPYLRHLRSFRRPTPPAAPGLRASSKKTS
jgi:hypothetical protein